MSRILYQILLTNQPCSSTKGPNASILATGDVHAYRRRDGAWMLVVTRNEGESLTVGDEIAVTVVGARSAIQLVLPQVEAA